MLCPHCGHHEMLLPWAEPDGLRLGHCVCGYVDYQCHAPAAHDPPAITSPAMRERTYGRAVCVICLRPYTKRSAAQLTCSKACSRKRHDQITAILARRRRDASLEAH